MAKKTKPKPKKIEIDEEFLLTILKTIKDIKNDVNALQQIEKEVISPKQAKNSNAKQDYIFQCFVASPNNAENSIEDIVLQQQRLNKFKQELEVLMKQHKVVQATATFLKVL